MDVSVQRNAAREAVAAREEGCLLLHPLRLAEGVREAQVRVRRTPTVALERGARQRTLEHGERRLGLILWDHVSCIVRLSGVAANVLGISIGIHVSTCAHHDQ